MISKTKQRTITLTNRPPVRVKRSAPYLPLMTTYRVRSRRQPNR